MNGLEMHVYDAETLEQITDATVVGFLADDVLFSVNYDETQEAYTGWYIAGIYTFSVLHDRYIDQNIELTFIEDGNECSQLELQQVDVYLEQEEPDSSVNTCDSLYDNLGNAALEMRACTSDSECVELWISTAGSCGCTHNLVVNSSANTTEYEEIGGAIDSQEGCGLYGTCDCPAADGVVCQDGLCGWNYI